MTDNFLFRIEANDIPVYIKINGSIGMINRNSLCPNKEYTINVYKMIHINIEFLFCCRVFGFWII